MDDPSNDPGTAGTQPNGRPSVGAHPEDRIPTSRARISRRDFLKYTGGATASMGLMARLDLAQAVLGQATGRGSTGLITDIFRADDMLALTFQFYNLKLLKAGQQGPGDPSTARLVRIQPQRPAYIVVQFEPQSVGERAFDVSESIGTRADASVAAQSRLAFTVPPATKVIPYTLQSLLSWQSFPQRVAPTAKVPPAGPYHPDIRQPTFTETALEAPWDLIVSPNDHAGWSHSMVPVTHQGRTELWHTRLGVRKLPSGTPVVDEKDATLRTIRALWDPIYGFDPNTEPPDGYIDPPGRTSLSLRDRWNIIRLTSDYFTLSYQGSDYRPIPVAVNRLMLTTLGAYLDVQGDWPDGITSKSNGQVVNLAQWRHLATLGRDHYVRVVTRGFIFPFGHRAFHITITERKFEEDESSNTGAWLWQRQFVVVREPDKFYPRGDPLRYQGRTLPYRDIRSLTLVTPNINPPDQDGQAQIPGYAASDAFWIRVGSDDFPFHLLGTDLEGHPVEFRLPVVFIAEGIDPTTLIINYNHPGDVPAARKTADLQGQKVGLASFPGQVPDAATHELLSMMFGAETPSVAVGGDEPAFYPKMVEAGVRLKAAEQVTGAPLPTPPTIQFHDDYVNGGPNPGQVFARLVDQVPLVFGGGSGGGVITPNMSIGGLSALTGPVGGDLTGGIPNKFDPQAFFGGLTSSLPKILGGIDLAAIIKDALFSNVDRVPVLQSLPKYPGGDPTRPPDQITTTMTWRPDLKPDPKMFFQPNPPGKTSAMVLQVVSVTTFTGGTPGATTVEVTGDLTDFRMNLLGVGDAFEAIHLDFKRLRFSSRDGKKPTVDVDIDEVTFVGVLEFLNTLRQYLSTTGVGGARAGADSPSSGLDVTVTPGGISVGYTLALPAIGVGVFDLENISLSAGLNLPFTGDPARVRFAFSEREHPFNLTVTLFGGGGFFGVGLGLDGFEYLEAALEFGAKLALDLGVASGGVSAMAGVYFKLESDKTTLTGYLRINGNVEVLGLVSVSVEFYMAFTYDSGTGEIYGQAQVTVSVEVLFFSTTVTLGPIEKRFAGGGSSARALSSADDNTATFADLMSKEDWAGAQGYAAWFAPAAF